MRKACNNSLDTVRPGTSWKAHKTFYAFVAVMTALLVYQWGWNRTQRLEPMANYTATAAVCHQNGFPAASAGGAVAAGAGVDFSTIQQHLGTTENVERAVRAADASIAALPPPDREALVRQTVAEVCRNLHVSTSATSTPRGVRIAIESSGRDPAFVVTLINTLANQYAQDCRAEWKARLQEAYHAACEASQQSHRTLAEAKARLDKVVAESGELEESDGTEAATAKGDSPIFVERKLGQSPARKLGQSLDLPQEPTTADNPDWVELDRQLGKLEQNRAKLLATRTPLHPAVIDAEDRIGELKRRLAQTPRTIAVPPTDTAAASAGATQPPHSAAGPAEPAEQPLAKDPAEQAKLAATLHDLRGEVYRAEEAQEAARQSERQAFEACQQPLRLEIQLAEPVDPHPPVPGLRVLLAAVTAALTVLGGVMMVAAGVVMEPTLGSVAEVEAILPVPVIGTLPTADHRSSATQKRQWLIRMTLIASGVAVIAGCLGLAWMIV